MNAGTGCLAGEAQKKKKHAGGRLDGPADTPRWRRMRQRDRAVMV